MEMRLELQPDQLEVANESSGVHLSELERSNNDQNNLHVGSSNANNTSSGLNINITNKKNKVVE